MASIAIIGGAGFIGGPLARELRNSGHGVKTVDVDLPNDGGVAHRHADVRDPDALREALQGSEVVYNLAAVHRDDVKPLSRYNEVNVAGAANVCEACAALEIDQLIFTSSVAVYGTAVPDAAEDLEPAPFNAYGRSKLFAEQVYRDWQAQAPGSRSLVVVRPTVVFGEGNRGNVYQLVKQISSGRFVMIGSGRNRKSMAYVGNVSAFLAKALECDAGAHLFNYVDKPDFSMQELVQTVLQTLGRRPSVGPRIPYQVGYFGGLVCDLAATITGKRLPISAVRVRKFCSTTTFSAQRVHSTGFQAPIGVREALVRTIRHELAAGGLTQAVDR